MIHTVSLTKYCRTGLIIAMLFFSTSHAVPPSFVIQSTLRDNKVPLQGLKSVIVNLYEKDKASILWTDTQPVLFVNGAFRLELGKTKDIPTGLLSSKNIEIELAIDGKTVPKMGFSAVPYARVSDETLGIEWRNVRNRPVALGDFSGKISLTQIPSGSTPNQTLKWDGATWTLAELDTGAGTLGPPNNLSVGYASMSGTANHLAINARLNNVSFGRLSTANIAKASMGQNLIVVTSTGNIRSIATSNLVINTTYANTSGTANNLAVGAKLNKVSLGRLSTANIVGNANVGRQNLLVVTSTGNIRSIATSNLVINTTYANTSGTANHLAINARLNNVSFGRLSTANIAKASMGQNLIVVTSTGNIRGVVLSSANIVAFIKDQAITLNRLVIASSNNSAGLYVGTPAVFQKWVGSGQIENGSNTTIDWRLGNRQKVSLAASNPFFVFTPPQGPSSLTLIIYYSNAASITATWPGIVKWPSGTAPALSGNTAKIDVVTFYYDGTYYLGLSAVGFQ